MRFNGRWATADDGRDLPVIDGGLVGPNGQTATVEFLIDTGAQATVLGQAAVEVVGPASETSAAVTFQGIAGATRGVLVATTVWFVNDTGDLVPFNGPFCGVTDPATGNDIYILGRDLLSHFVLIVDRPGDIVCLLTGRHRYVIQEA